MHISAKTQPKNLKQHFDWGPGLPGYVLKPASLLVISLGKALTGLPIPLSS